MLQFVGKARRCDAVAVGEWRPAGTGAGYSPGGACYGKAYEQTYALCGSGALLRFVFFELPSETDSPVESSDRLPTLDVPSNRIEAAASKVVAIRNASTPTASAPGVPQRVVLVNSAQSAVMGR
jgi:hypothetical protein